MIDKIKKINDAKKIIPYTITWFIFAFILVVKNYGAEVGVINSSMMAFSYEYGFISRGLIGTIYQILNDITPFNLMDYNSLLKFTVLIAVAFICLLFAFFLLTIIKSRTIIIDELKYLIYFYSMFAVPMFVTYEHLGRFDIYCIMLSLMGAILILIEKAEWMVIIFSALGVMVHQGNVFMFLNIILVLLLYKALSTEGKKRKKYIIILISSFLVASVLFLYFEFFSHANGEYIYEDVIASASALGKNGGIHIDVIDHEILGIDLSSREYAYRLRNIVEFIIYLVLMLPYIVLAIKFFGNIMNAASTKLEKVKYIIVSIGAGTMLPMLLLKCDYGRWMFAIISYYFVVVIALLGMKDVIIEQELKSIINHVRTKSSMTILLFAYPLLLTPFLDVEITYVVAELADKVNAVLLHWW